MRQSEVIRHYSRRDIAEELVRLAQSREVAVQFQSDAYGKRPDILQFPSEVGKLAWKGAVSFHASEEIWSDPLQLSSEITPAEMSRLRTGFDLILDIDSPNITYGKPTAEIILKALEHHGIYSASIKFSGGKGFHIGVPFKALPKNIRGKPIELLFPDAPRTVAEYLKEFIRPHLAESILDNVSDIKQIMKDTGKKKEELLVKSEEGLVLNPYSFMEIDTVLIAPRHLFRMAYSLHEGSGLVSVPLKDLDSFELKDAKPDNVEEVHDWFLNDKGVESEEASQLLVQAFDWEERKEENKEVRALTIHGKLGEPTFPPCIKHILQGLSDGRKRSVFILANFLKSLNWDINEIEARLEEWNKKNDPPLKDGYIRAQLVWHKRHPGQIPPPNCDNLGFYKDIGICKPDALCKRIKNPLTYSARKARRNR